MPKIQPSSNPESSVQEKYFLGTMTQKEREGNNPALQIVIRDSISTLFPDANLDDCLTNITQGYNDPHRAFHDFQHIFQILPPVVQQKIVTVQEHLNRGSTYEEPQATDSILTNEEKQTVISAAYHDAKYHIDDKGVRDISARLASKGNFEEVDEADRNGAILKYREARFIDIKEELVSQGFRQEDVVCIRDLFGIQEDPRFTVGKMNSGLKLDGAPMNEFLSALTAMRDLAPDGIENLTLDRKKNLFQTVIDIQMTVPFQQDHARHLFENVSRVGEVFGVSDRSELIGMVNNAVDMSNRDIGNLLHKDFIHMLYGDYTIAAEFRADGKPNHELPVSGLYSSVTNPGFAQFVMKPALDQNRLAQPRLAEDGHSLITGSDEYEEKKKNAEANIEASILTTKAMGAAITLLCVG